MEIRTWALQPTLGSLQHRTPGHSRPGSPKAVSSSRPPAELHHAASCCFSTNALRQLSLALGVAGLQLQRLVLDHSVLSDEGISTLASGLSCFSSLNVLSLRYCNIGPAGALQLAEALVPACKHHGMEGVGGSVAAASGASASRMSLSCVNPQLAPVAPATPAQAAGAASSTTNTTLSSSTASSSKQPILQQLHLDGNPLGAAGLHAVSKAVRWMTGIKELTLAGIHLDCSMPADQLEVQVLAHSLLTGPNEINMLDFKDNHISEWRQWTVARPKSAAAHAALQQQEGWGGILLHLFCNCNLVPAKLEWPGNLHHVHLPQVQPQPVQLE